MLAQVAACSKVVLSCAVLHTTPGLCYLGNVVVLTTLRSCHSLLVIARRLLYTSTDLGSEKNMKRNYVCLTVTLEVYMDVLLC